MKQQDGTEELIKTDEAQLFWSVEYTDDEGDLNIKHVVATPIEMSGMIEEFIKRGISAKAYMINPPS